MTPERKLAYDYATAGDDEPVPMIGRKGLQAVIAEPDPYEAKELYARWEAQRLASMRTGPVPTLLEKGVMRPEVTPDEAAAIFWMLTDPALYHRMVVEAGWTAERFSSWPYETITTQALIPRSTVTPPRMPRSRPAGPGSPGR